MTLCECGCGETVNPGRRFISGHNRRGVTLSEATCEKMRVATIKRFDDPEERQKARDKAIEQWDDPEARKEAAERTRKTTIMQWKDPVKHQRLIDGQLRRWKDPVKREELINSIIKGWEDPTSRELARESALQYIIDNPEKAKANKVRGGVASQLSQDGSPSSIEFRMRKILKDNNYHFETNKPLLNMCIPDIVFKDEKIIIQCDGDYWHDYPNGTDRDYEQDKILKQNGWQVIRFWEHEINGDIDGCLDKFQWKTFRRFNT